MKFRFESPEGERVNEDFIRPPLKPTPFGDFSGAQKFGLSKLFTIMAMCHSWRNTTVAGEDQWARDIGPVRAAASFGYEFMGWDGLVCVVPTPFGMYRPTLVATVLRKWTLSCVFRFPDGRIRCFMRPIWAHEISLFVPHPHDIAHPDSGSGPA